MRGSSEQSGATTVEFALVAVLFFTLVFGLLSFGWFLWTKQALTAAAREAARYGIATQTSLNGGPQYKDCVGIRAAAVFYAPELELKASEINVRYYEATVTNLASASPKADCQAGGAPDPSTVPIGDGDRVVVEISRVMSQTLPFMGGWSPTAHATAARTVFPVGAG
jgi:Flp pilus assembly protein TadG